VSRARRQLDHAAGADPPAPPPHSEEQFPGGALEALPLVRMDVRWNESARWHEELAGNATGRAFAKDDALSAHGIGDCVYAFLDHLI
jgi:hypothetical protein